MPLSPNSLAPAVGTAAKNVQFQSFAEVLTRKNLIIGTYDPSITTLTDDEPVRVSSPDAAGALTGFGFMLHRLAERFFDGSQGVETWLIPQAEAGGATASAGDIDFTGSALTVNGTLYLYIAGIQVPVVLADGDDGDDIALKVVAAITADNALPVTAAVNGVTSGQVDFTSKSKGPWGDDIELSFNEGFQEALPAGVLAVVTGMTGGAGIPDIDDALTGLGTGDNQNENHYTDVVHGYGDDTSTLNKLSIYNGPGQEFSGNYDKLVARPFRVLTGDTTPGDSGLNALIAFGNSRRETDRTNGTIAAPGSPNHPAEIAAVAMGVASRLNSIRAEETTYERPLPGIYAGDKSERWTDDYDNRDSAYKAGISPTLGKGGAVFLQGLLTYYHPTSVPLTSNGYRSMRNVSIIQNMLHNGKLNFQQEKWKGTSIVEDKSEVGSITSRQKARDKGDVLDDLLGLTDGFSDNAWIYNKGFTVDRLKANLDSYIQIRSGGDGFTWILPVLLSGEGLIFDGLIQFDTALTVVL